MKHLGLISAFALLVISILSTSALAEDRAISYPPWYGYGPRRVIGLRDRIRNQRVAVALARRGWISDAVDSIKEGAKNIGDKVNAEIDALKGAVTDALDDIRNDLNTIYHKYAGREARDGASEADEEARGVHGSPKEEKRIYVYPPTWGDFNIYRPHYLKVPARALE